MCAESRFGMISRLATPFNFELGKCSTIASGDSARVACISPSTISSGSFSWISFSAARIFLADAELRLPKLECDISAAFGLSPKRATSSAARKVMSAIASAVGSVVMCVSQINSVYLLEMTALSADTSSKPFSCCDTAMMRIR